jgi:trehalose synthase
MGVREQFGLDPERELILQVSRFDRFKDPVGVIHSYRLARRSIPTLQLVLAGGEATDDPEGAAVLEEVRQAAADDPDIKILLLPADAHRTINALQRSSDLVLQKSVREGFGLTVTEAMWKGKPVIGGNTGGIRLQIVNHHTGFLVDSPEGAALRIRYLLSHRLKLEEMGEKAQAFVHDNFLLTRHLVEYLTLIHGVAGPNGHRIELS